MTEASPGTTTINHVGIIVGDIEAAARAWSETLGVPPPVIRETDGYERAHTEYRGEPTNARAKLAFLVFGQFTVELIEPIDGPSVWRDHLEQRGASLHSIGFRVQDMAGRSADLADRGIPVVQRGEIPGGRYAYFDAVPRLGSLLELLEFDPIEGTTRA